MVLSCNNITSPAAAALSAISEAKNKIFCFKLKNASQVHLLLFAPSTEGRETGLPV